MLIKSNITKVFAEVSENFIKAGVQTGNLLETDDFYFHLVFRNAHGG